MHGNGHPDLIALIDQLSRLQGRLRGLFAGLDSAAGLSRMEMTVLTAVAEAERAPTVPQIGRSLGHPRQVVQRAANTLIEAGLIDTRDNPDHKRAMLLVATDRGRAMKQAANAQAAEIAQGVMPWLDAGEVREAARLLERIRKGLDAHRRDG
ncbi:MAG: helix-turn-helix domain-containing protein [Blastomonas sp.]